MLQRQIQRFDLVRIGSALASGVVQVSERHRMSRRIACQETICNFYMGLKRGALIRYYFDYERARIWRLRALETSRHDRSVQRP